MSPLSVGADSAVIDIPRIRDLPTLHGAEWAQCHVAFGTPRR